MDLLSLSLEVSFVHFLKTECRHECCRTPLFWDLPHSDKNSWYGKRPLRELVLIPPILRSLWRPLSTCGVLYELGSYYSNYFMTNAVQKTVQTCEMICLIKINRHSGFLFGPASVWWFVRSFTSDVEPPWMPCNSPSYKSSTRSLPCSFCHQSTVLYLNIQLGLVVIFCPFRSLISVLDLSWKSQPYFKSRQMFWGQWTALCKKI